mmetsp:Transcript_22748/g.63475  ORF Transcript_22748/g.63475 Transcript_22748/m.63475 type:complete len:467 (+) Transcript_22748:112-1512(+)
MYCVCIDLPILGRLTNNSTHPRMVGASSTTVMDRPSACRYPHLYVCCNIAVHDGTLRLHLLLPPPDTTCQKHATTRSRMGIRNIAANVVNGQSSSRAAGMADEQTDWIRPTTTHLLKAALLLVRLLLLDDVVELLLRLLLHGNTGDLGLFGTAALALELGLDDLEAPLLGPQLVDLLLEVLLHGLELFLFGLELHFFRIALSGVGGAHGFDSVLQLQLTVGVVLVLGLDEDWIEDGASQLAALLLDTPVGLGVGNFREEDGEHVAASRPAEIEEEAGPGLEGDLRQSVELEHRSDGLHRVILVDLGVVEEGGDLLRLDAAEGVEIVEDTELVLLGLLQSFRGDGAGAEDVQGGDLGDEAGLVQARRHLVVQARCDAAFTAGGLGELFGELALGRSCIVVFLMYVDHGNSILVAIMILVVFDAAIACSFVSFVHGHHDLFQSSVEWIIAGVGSLRQAGGAGDIVFVG